MHLVRKSFCARPNCAAALLVLAVLSLPVLNAAADDAGYEVRRSQEKTSAPTGWVGYKTIDREYRTGNTDATRGHSTDATLTAGGFVRECPTAEGTVRGDFEISVLTNDVRVTDGSAVRTHYNKSLRAVLEGHVNNDGELDYVDGEVILLRAAGAAHERFNIRFQPRAGEPDWEALKAAVELTAEIWVAALELTASSTYMAAEVGWLKPNTCVEIRFAPASETERLKPGASRDVKATLATKDGGTPVAGATFRVQAINNIGSVEPRAGQTAEDGTLTIKYTAAARPKRGHGIDAAVASKAGAADGFWKILDDVKEYELRFESTVISRDPVQAAQSTATGTLRLTGAEGESRRYPGTGKRILYRGADVISFVTMPLPGRDPCDPLVSGTGRSAFRVPEALIELPAEGETKPARIEIVYDIGMGGGETENIPAMEDYICVLRPERAMAMPFWWPAFLSGRETEGEMNVFKDWAVGGSGGIVATKILTGDCGGLCDEERTVLTLREVNAAPGNQ